MMVCEEEAVMFQGTCPHASARIIASSQEPAKKPPTYTFELMHALQVMMH